MARCCVGRVVNALLHGDDANDAARIAAAVENFMVYIITIDWLSIQILLCKIMCSIAILLRLDLDTEANSAVADKSTQDV